MDDEREHGMHEAIFDHDEPWRCPDCGEIPSDPEAKVRCGIKRKRTEPTNKRVDNANK